MRGLATIALGLAVIASGCRGESKKSSVRIAGVAVTVAPIKQAHIVALAIEGGDRVVGDGRTDDEGKFDLQLAPFSGALRIEVRGDRGGTTEEPILKRPIELSVSDCLTLLVPNTELGRPIEGLVISPWTTFLATRATLDAKLNDKPLIETLAHNVELFTNHFAGRSFMESTPLPLDAPTNGLSSGALHGLAVSGIALVGHELGRTLGITPGGLLNVVSLTSMLTDDLQDLVFDGTRTGASIMLFNDKVLSRDFLRTDMASALGSFLVSSANLSGLTTNDVGVILSTIALDQSLLFSPFDNSLVSTGDGPTITLTSPLLNATVGTKTKLSGQAESVRGVLAVEITLDDKTISDAAQRVNNQKLVWNQELEFNDGFHRLVVKATDSTNVTSSLVVTFASDKTAPTIDFSFCHAFDDEKRRPTVSFDAGAVTNWAGPVPDFGCTDAALAHVDSAAPTFAFRSYAELAKRNDTASLFAVVVKDPGDIATKPEALVVTAQLFDGVNAIGNPVPLKQTSATDSTRRVYLSAEMFGDAFLSLHGDKGVELRVRAEDSQKNVTERAFFFTFNARATPLPTKGETLVAGSSDLISTYRFVDNNIQRLVDPTIVLPQGVFVHRRFLVRNVSDREVRFGVQINNAEAKFLRRRWQGLVAGEEVNPVNLGITAPPDGECEIASPSRTQSSFPANPPIWVIAAGTAPYCAHAEDFLGEGVPASSTVPFRMLVNGLDGAPIAVDAAKQEWAIPPGATYRLTFGFEQPSFGDEQNVECLPTYGPGASNILGDVTNWNNGSPIFYRALSYSRTPVVAVGGIVSRREMYTLYTPTTDNMHTKTTATGYGFVDCTGISCTGAGCLGPSNALLLRVKYGNYATHLAMSRMFWERSIDRSGHSLLRTTSHIVGNPVATDATFTLPEEDFDLARNHPNTAPPADVVRYTIGDLLP